jgi:DNA topoisomerase-1
MLLRRGRYGPFLSCARYPDCKGVVNLDKKGNIKHPSPPPLLVEDVECTKCGAALNLRRGKRGPWLSCSKFPKCRGRVGWTKLDEAKQQDLEKRLTQHEAQNPVPQVTRIDGTVVGESEPPRILAPDEVPAGVLEDSDQKKDKK